MEMGGKVWNDTDNQDAIRPSAVSVDLLADGDVIDSIDFKSKKAKFEYMYVDYPYECVVLQSNILINKIISGGINKLFYFTPCD